METLDFLHHIDEPPTLLLWRIDDLMALVLALVAGILAGQPTIALLLGAMPSHGYRRFRDLQADGYALPLNLSVSPGTTVLIEIAIGHLNRIATPFADPVVHTVSNASTQVDGSVVDVATDTEDPVALYIGDGQGSTLALALTLAPRYVPPREVRLTVPGYQSKRAGNATATRAVVDPVAVTPMLANASDRDGDGDGDGTGPAYVSDLVEQLRALAQGRMPEGFRIAKGSSGTKLRCAEGLKVRSSERAEGQGSDLLKTRVANTGAQAITLEHDTCRPDAATATVAAMAAWPRRVLASGEETEVFLLLARDAPPHRTTGQPR